MPGILTYWRTVRHLRPVQIYGRIRFRFARPKPNLALPPDRRERSGSWTTPPARAVSLAGPLTFRFFGASHDISTVGWDNPTIDRLWRYNLHYFDDLSTEPSAERSGWQRALLQRWVQENDPGVGTGWEPYPTSLRVVNWIKWSLGGNELSPECLHSLAVQVRWLSQRLEWHILGNHLFANAKALVFAGLYFKGSEADSWRETGMRILESELDEQVLGDGGHFELSTMYHALAVEDVLDLCNVASAFGASDSRPIQAMHARAPDMLRWMATMTHPDGEIGFFNDAALGIALAPQAIARYAERLGIVPPSSRAAMSHLEHTGYVRMEESGAVALLDVARVGPDHLPAHAHADTLSFELSVFGQRVLVNSGTSHYGMDAERLRQRGTAAHNTVVVDGADSSEVWASFRVARRARPVGLTVGQAGTGALTVECGHDGYRRLGGGVVHRRRWTFQGATILIADDVSGRYSRAESMWHLHPSVRVTDPVREADGTTVLLHLNDTRTVRLEFRGATVRADRSTWHPQFGTATPNICLVATLNGSRSEVRITWPAA
jgi:uncharacterized heparinase superfamily protein